MIKIKIQALDANPMKTQHDCYEKNRGCCYEHRDIYQ